MKTFTTEVALANIKTFLMSNVVTPYIVVVDDGKDYSDLIKELDSYNQMCVSDFCATEDSFPDYDALCNAISDIHKNTILIGLGESVRLSGDSTIISKIKDLPVNNKVVILCRGIREIVRSLCSDDNKFNTKRRVCFLRVGQSYDIVNFSLAINVPAEMGIRALLKRLEVGVASSVFVKTDLPLMCVKEVCTAYGAIQQVNPVMLPSEECLVDSLWEEYLSDNNLEGYELSHWRTFLKMKSDPPKNKYMKYVMDKSVSYVSYKKNLYSALLDFLPIDMNFFSMYEERKILLKDIKCSEIAEYVAESKVKGNEQIYYLTDNTSVERQAIIAALVGVSLIPDELTWIYPSLAEYLHDYVFIGSKAELLTGYFAEYKRLKLTNRLSNEFLQRVLDLAKDGSRPYNVLKTRGAVLDSIKKDNTTLYWIDSLGVEFLGYIQSRAKILELKISVHIAKANLPTITSQNNDFYNVWNGLKVKTKKLDDLKHAGEQDFNYEATKTPIHLASELSIIDDFLEWSVSHLKGKKNKKVLLVSDHGASRLAVINGQECKWEMALKGQHSGRCCPCSEVDVKSEYATQENGFWVLANYDRFKGGRKASVEVHGGATLEEVVIPLIEIELYDDKISISNTTPVTMTSFKKNAEIILFSANNLKAVSVQVNDKYYSAESVDSEKFKIIFTDIKKAGKYTAYVYEGDNLIGQVEFEVQRESGKTNDDDWF